MARFLHLARYTANGMRGALVEGMVARQAMYDSVVSAAGGKLLSYHLVADGNWDIAIINDFPDELDHAAAARMAATFRAAGSLDEIVTFRLATPADFDAASRSTEETYVAPTAGP